MQVSSLRLYPVKGLRGFEVASAALERVGLRDDRRWAVAAEDGTVLTQRETPAMARIDVRIEGGGLRLECAGFGGVGAQATATPVTIDIWRNKVAAVVACSEASAWLSRVLGQRCTLVHQVDPQSRPVTPDLAVAGDHVSLADGFPLLVTTTASLADLNRRLADAVLMDRFRPNLVVDGATAWAEDAWPGIRAGATRLRFASPCSRCKVTTLDQRTGLAPARTEPLKTLGTFHRDEGGRITFGWNAIPEQVGTIKVGDPVTLP